MSTVTRRLKRAEEVTEGPYELKELQAPVLRGFALTTFVNLFEGSVGDLIYPSLAQKSGVTQVSWAPPCVLACG
jgi:hypothetical protein